MQECILFGNYKEAIIYQRVRIDMHLDFDFHQLGANFLDGLVGDGQVFPGHFYVN